MREPLENAELVAFTKTVDARSLSRAAAELRVPRATLGRRLSRLEERLGTRLLLRTTRSLTLTDAGATFYRHARIVLDAVNSAEESVAGASAQIAGELRVSVPPFVLDDTFADVLTAFAQKYPAVRLQVHFSSQHVDVRRDGYNVVIRAGEEIEPGLVARTLVRSKVIAVASPGYLAANGKPKRATDLKKHRCLMGFARGEVPQRHWRSRRAPLAIEGVFFSNEPRILRDAAVRGLGIAFLPRLLIEDALAAGALVQVLAGIVETDNSIALVYPEREYLPAHVRAFADAVAAWASKRVRPQRASSARTSVANASQSAASLQP